MVLIRLLCHLKVLLCGKGLCHYEKRLDHILTLQALIEECRALNERIYVCFVNFLKPSTVCLLNLCNSVLLDM